MDDGNDWLIKDRTAEINYFKQFFGDLNKKPKIKYQVTIQSNKMPQILHYTFTDEELSAVLQKLKTNLAQGGIEDYDVNKNEQDHSVIITIND